MGARSLKEKLEKKWRPFFYGDSQNFVGGGKKNSRGDTLGTYYDSINNIMDNNNIDLIINFALKTKRLLKKDDKDDTGVT